MNGDTKRVTNQPHARLAALTALLVLALILAAVSAWQAVAAGSRHRDTAERALADYADFAAFVLATGVYRELGLEVLSTFAALPPWQSAAVFELAPPPSRCGGHRVYFEYQPGTGDLRFAHDGIAPAAVTQLRDTLLNAATLFNEASWRFRHIRLDLAGAGNGVFIVPVTLPGEFGVRGLSACLWRDPESVDFTRRWTALPPSLTRTTPLDSLYAVTIGGATGPDLYASPVSYPATFAGVSRLGNEFGDLAVTVSLNPAIAPALVIGGLPTSRLPGALGVFLLSALLLAAAALQLRREYRSIGIRSEFVSNVSHELRTPLSQILIFTELLKLGRLRTDAERKRSLDIIDQETRRLIRLVENVLQFSRSAATSTPPVTDLAVLPVVQETIEAFRPLADARGVTLAVDIPPGVAAVANRNSLRQILLNLLDNAVKYGPEGQTVRVEAGRRNGGVELAVEDQGPGIPFDDRERIWDGFQRLERESASPVSGSGIGLSVVRSLVDRMGGQVRVADSSTGGSRFVVTLQPGDAGVDT